MSYAAVAGFAVNAGLGIMGSRKAAKEAARDRALLRGISDDFKQVNFNPFTTRFGGAGVSFAGNTANLDMGQFQGINDLFGSSGLQNLQQGGNLQRQANNMLSPQNEMMANQLAGMAGMGAQGLSQNGFQQALQQQLFGQAGQLAGQTDFSGLRDDTLATLRAQAAPQEERAFAGLQDNLFATGRLGSSGGALQTEAFAKGLANADLGRQLAATNVAQQQQQQNANIANMFGGLGSGIAGLESDLLNAAFGRFGQTSGLAADLNQARFGRGSQMFGQSLQGLQGQQSIMDSILGLGTFGANIGAQKASTRLSALTGAGEMQKAAAGITGPGTIMGGMMTQAGANDFGGNLMSMFSKFSDRRLKEDVAYVATDAKGHHWYSWKWNSEAEALGISEQPTYGVMADEVMAIRPEAVTEDVSGFLMVNYGAL